LEAKKRLCGAKFGSISEDVETATPSLDLATLPTAFDWRDKDGIDWVTSVKDQNPCGTCWVFGTLGSLEAAINIYNDDPDMDMDLSEQMVLSCSDNIFYTPTCTGGYPQDALNYLRYYGTSNEACFPYQCPIAGCPDTGVPCNCCSDWAEKAWKVTYAKVSPDTTAVYKAALLQYGPLGVPVFADEDLFYYKGGIYEPVLESEEWTEAFTQEEANHWVTLVGYDDDGDAGGYWIIKNSWGADWGEQGYGKILYGNIEKHIHTYAITSMNGPDNCKSVTVFNDGNSSLDVTDVTISYNAGEATGWLDAERKSFSLAPLSSEGITVWIDAAGLSAGEYHGTLNIISNDPDEASAPVTVTLKLDAPINNPPQLSNPSVQPPSGTPSTSFYYQVNYYDSDGDSPSVKQVYVDGTAQTMSLYSGSASNGVYRYGPRNLSVGSHNYYFYFENGKGGIARLPASGSYSGPLVSGTGAATATRDLPTRVEPGANFDVTIEASGCGSMGQVRETLPAGFTYVSCPDPDIGVEVKDSEVWFTFLSDGATFTYIVAAPVAEDTYTFAGVVVDESLKEFPVGGDTEVRVWWSPWAYDVNEDGIIQKGEAIKAVQDYFSGKISKMQAIEVVMLYFG